MDLGLHRRRDIIIWQLLFLVLGSTWLWAPHLNHVISYRTALISQYESGPQPYAWLFRLGDIAAAALLLVAARALVKLHNQKVTGYLLLVIGIGMLIDPLIPTTCRMKLGVCEEYVTPAFIIHAAETVITASAFFAIGVYDSWRRKRLVSIAFVCFQIAYLLLFITQLASEDQFNTLSQYLYQTILLVWAAWLCGELLADERRFRPSARESHIIKRTIAVWAFVSGVLAILVSMAHIHLLGRVRGLYFTGDNAWLAQHGVVVGVTMLYLSRHLARGELRARQFFLWVVGLETLKYSVIAPNPTLMTIYLVTFCVLFVLRDDFDRGIVAMTLRLRIKEVLYMLAALTASSLLALALLYRNHKLAEITHDSIDNFFDYTLRSEVLSHTQTKSALLAHTISAFVLVSIGTILWILFRPYRNNTVSSQNYDKAEELLVRYSRSSEDYFKLWPHDKQYFWSTNESGFIAYKIVGPVAFALADPTGNAASRPRILAEFIAWCRARRLRACFLPIYPESIEMYKQADLHTLKIGASALIQAEGFLEHTVRDKWWRWQTNRAAKNGYRYEKSFPPHTHDLLRKFRIVSDEWLTIDEHQEHGFALGRFDEAYMQKCLVHYLTDGDGAVVAFTNELPVYAGSKTATVDLMRYLPDANNAMPFLLSRTIESVAKDGRISFDLGFVPFASTKGPLLTIARTLSAGRFSAKGLEQFKNKFKPTWRPNYLAYDGDLTDLALIAANLERAMTVKVD